MEFTSMIGYYVYFRRDTRRFLRLLDNRRFNAAARAHRSQEITKKTP